MTEQPPRRPNPCATCGACCRSYLVPVCGYDVWLISTRQHLSPEHFLIVLPQKRPGLDGFRLSPDGPPYGLALDKRGRLHPKQPCVFLVELAGGHARCGVYDHRPVVCQAYPMALREGAVAQRGDALCPPGAWPAAAVARPAWRVAQQRQRLHFDVYHEVVARWNARVAQAGEAFPAIRFAYGEYLSYLTNVYTRLADEDGEDGEDGADGETLLARALAGWPPGLPPGVDIMDEHLPRGVPAWLAYLRRVRAIIGWFYPSVPAAPGPVLVPATPPAAPSQAVLTT